MRLLAVAVVLLVLSGCARVEPLALEPSVVPSRAVVPWEDYPSEMRDIVDGYELERDCAALQTMFDVQFESNAWMLESTAHGNADVMAYIFEAQELAGCFD